jgi:hypothetical protein
VAAQLEPALEGEVNFQPMISCEVIPQNPTFNDPEFVLPPAGDLL